MKNLQETYENMNRHLIEDKNPSDYFKGLSEEDGLNEYPFSLLKRLKETEQSNVYHPEGSVWNHTMLVIEEAAKVKEKSEDERAFMWAALLHDLGKPDSTRLRNGKITSYDHDRIGADLAKEFLNHFHEKGKFIKRVSALIRWHMQILHVAKNSPHSQIKQMLKEVSIEEMALLGLCDRLGRGKVDRETEEYYVTLFIQKCKKEKGIR